ncbi:hypothetical protein C8Q74DRAFT_1222742 [Fomes fomentarius]|nr:hypothetical protein C8Q74DRAFT_1222742 [Fomes fomentarius]
MYSRLRVLSLSECSYEKYFDHFNALSTSAGTTCFRTGDWPVPAGVASVKGVQSPRKARTVLRRVDQDLVSDASNRCWSSPVAAGARPQLVKQQKSRFRQSWAAKGKDYSFDAANDILVTRTGWDMDPFVVVSFGKEVFRTRVIRHSLNPQWDEKMLFHVRRYETTFKLIEDAPQKDAKTGLYPEEEDWKRSMRRCQKEDWKPEAHKGDYLRDRPLLAVCSPRIRRLNGLEFLDGRAQVYERTGPQRLLSRWLWSSQPPPRARRMDHDDLDLFEGLDSDEDEDEDDEELSEDDDEPSLPKRNRRW